MQNKLFLKAADICELLEVKQTSAYEIIGNLNKELEEQGYLTLRGKVPTKYFVKRFYGVEDTCEIPQEEGKAFLSGRSGLDYNDSKTSMAASSRGPPCL